MFEDSTFESEGRIGTRSRRWMALTLIFNLAILLALILIPLVYPEGLPRQALAFLLTTPPPPPPQLELPKQRAHAFHGTPEMNGSTLITPPLVSRIISDSVGPQQALENPLITMDSGPGMPDGGTGVFGRRTATVVGQEGNGPVRVSSGLMSGNLIYKTLPIYPPIAREAHVEGTVILQATVSKSGTIENLRVISGSAVLQQAALDAVRTWRYRPYLLDGQPVQVETTVNVVFKLGS